MNGPVAKKFGIVQRSLKWVAMGSGFLLVLFLLNAINNNTLALNRIASLQSRSTDLVELPGHAHAHAHAEAGTNLHAMGAYNWDIVNDSQCRMHYTVYADSCSSGYHLCSDNLELGGKASCSSGAAMPATVCVRCESMDSGCSRDQQTTVSSFYHYFHCSGSNVYAE